MADRFISKGVAMRVVIHGANESRVDVPVRRKARDRAGCSCGGSRDAPRAVLRPVAGRGTHVYIHGIDASFTSHRDERSVDAEAPKYNAKAEKFGKKWYVTGTGVVENSPGKLRLFNVERPANNQGQAEELARRENAKSAAEIAHATTAGAGYRLANAKEYLQSRAGRGGSSGNQLGFNFDGRP